MSDLVADIAEAERQAAEKQKLKVGSIVVVGTATGSFMAKVKKITKKDIVIRRITAEK